MCPSDAPHPFILLDQVPKAVYEGHRQLHRGLAGGFNCVLLPADMHRRLSTSEESWLDFLAAGIAVDTAKGSARDTRLMKSSPRILYQLCSSFAGHHGLQEFEPDRTGSANGDCCDDP